MKKILLLCQQQGCPIEVSPARYQLIHELRKKNYEIYVLYPGSIKDKTIKSEIQHFTNTSNLSMQEIRNKIINIAPECIIAFTYEDTKILYRLMWKMRKTVFVYYNLEIYTPSMERYAQIAGKYFKERCVMAYLSNKLKEIIYTRGCKIFVIQDDLRKRTSSEYFISHPNTLLIPNSYVYNDNYEISHERKGIVYSGGLNKLQLKSLFQNPDNFPDVPITFAGWGDRWFQIQYMKLKKTHPDVAYCNQKLPPEELSEYLDQFAVGLIWYSPIRDKNINNIGLASGKLFKHLSLGQPIIVVDCPGISEVINKYRLGIVIHDIRDLQKAYEKIMKRYSYYQKNVQVVYKNKFDYIKVIQPFLEQLGD